MASPRTPGLIAGPQHSVGFSIPSIVNPPSSGDHYRTEFPGFHGALTGSDCNFVPIASYDEIDYSESSQSPISDYHSRYPHPSSIPSSPSVGDIYCGAATPLISTLPGWEPMLLPPSALPTVLENDSRGYVTVGAPLLLSMHSC